MSDNPIFDQPPEIVLDGFATEVQIISAKIRAPLYLLSKGDRLREPERQIEHIQMLLDVLDRTTSLVKDYLTDHR